MHRRCGPRTGVWGWFQGRWEFGTWELDGGEGPVKTPSKAWAAEWSEAARPERAKAL